MAEQEAALQTPGQIVCVPQEALAMVDEGQGMAFDQQFLKVSEVACQCWKDQPSGMTADETRRLTVFEAGNRSRKESVIRMPALYV